MNLGQYFTTNETLKEKVYFFIRNDSNIILEPSVGRGDLVEYVLKNKPNIIFDMYEIDETIDFLPKINKKDIIFGDFLLQNITKKYKTIIGNPPYVKSKKGNLYIKFIEKCFSLLIDGKDMEKNSISDDIQGGELIFIIPSDFFKLTSASKLLDTMMEQGNFTDIYHPHDEKLFKNASIDVIVFRYVKNSNYRGEKITNYNNERKRIRNNNGLITFESMNNEIIQNTYVQDYFDIYVGLVSGKDAIFQNDELGNINILTGNGLTKKFIYLKQFPTQNVKLNEFMLSNKQELMNRKICKINEYNWFKFGAIRNIKIMEENYGKPCIYMYNITRNETICFLGTVNYFGGQLLMMIPKKECNLQNFVDYFNSYEFKQNYMFSGRFKIGHRQLMNAILKNKG